MPPITRRAFVSGASAALASTALAGCVTSEPVAVAPSLASQVLADPVIAVDAGPVGDVLAGRALEFGADLLVMGAFGRPRALERVLGGATRAVLAGATLPVLFSH